MGVLWGVIVWVFSLGCSLGGVLIVVVILCVFPLGLFSCVCSLCGWTVGGCSRCGCHLVFGLLVGVIFADFLLCAFSWRRYIVRVILC